MTALQRWVPVMLLAASACQGFAQTPTARASADSTDYRVGDAIRVHVALTFPKGIVLRPAIGDTLGGYTILERRPLVQRDDTSGSTEVVVSRYEQGSAELPPLPFEYSLPGDSVARTVATNPLVFNIHTVTVDTTKDIRDLKPPLSIPISLAEILLYLGILAAVALLVYVLYRLWKRRAQKTVADVPAAPSRPAHVIALEELAILKEKRLWQKGLIKEYYSEVTEILRRYIENRYTIKALEETTDEILAGLAESAMPGDVLRSLEKSFRRADLVKFAKAQPGISEHEEIMTTAYDTVERTKFVPQPPAEVKTGDHGGK